MDTICKAAILKFFKSHLLPNGSLTELKHDGDIWMLWKFRLLKSFCSNVKDGCHLKFFRPHLLPNSKSVRLRWNDGKHRGVGGWGKVLGERGGGGREGVTWIFRISKSFSSNIQDSGHSGDPKTLQTTSDSGFPEAIWSNSQDGHHGTI